MVAAKKRSKKSAAPKDKGIISTRLVFDISDEIPSYYINYIEVAQTEHEFSLYSVQVPGKPTAEQVATARESGEIHMEPLFQMILPPTIIRGLISAFESQLDLYEKQHGEIRPKKDSGSK